MATASSTPRKIPPQGVGPPAKKSYSAAMKHPPGHKTNAAMQEAMVRTEIDPAVMVKFALLKDLKPCDVAQLITSYGLPVQSIFTMFAVEVGRITVQMTSQQYAEELKQKHRSNMKNGQDSLRLLEEDETMFVSVSRVFGDFSDEKVKSLVFGDNASKVVSINYERYKTAKGELLWFTGRRFYNFLKVDHDALPDLPPYVVLDKNHRSYVRVQGRKRQCLRCKSENHLIADCPEKEERRIDTISEEEETDKEESSSEGEEEDDQKKEDPPFAVSQDISNISEGTEDFEEVPEAGNTVVTQSNTSNPAWASRSYYTKKRKFPAEPVKFPKQWKEEIKRSKGVPEEDKEKILELEELTTESLRADPESFFALISPNVTQFTDDPEAEDFDYDETFLLGSISFLYNNANNTI